MKNTLKKVLKVVLGVLLVLVIFVTGFVIYSQNYRVEEQSATIENTTGLVQTSGKSLYDADGNKLVLQGINAGQILLQEGWMSPFALEPLKNEDLKCNIATCTYEEYLETCEKVKTENCVTATLYEVIQEYNQKYKQQ